MNNLDELLRNDFLINESVFGKINESLFSQLYAVNELISATPKEKNSFIFNGENPGKKIWLHKFQLEKWKGQLLADSIEHHKAYPLSSGRSFIVDQNIIKVSLPSNTMQPLINKPLYSVQIERANLISAVLHERQLKNNLKLKAQLEHSGGWWAQHFEGEGFLFRKLDLEHQKRSKRLVPYYAFFSRKENDNEVTSYFQKNLVLTNQSPVDWILNTILIPIVTEALQLYWQEGITIEMHQQNILIELNPDDSLTGQFYFRDIDGCRLDCDLRQHKNLNINFVTKNNTEWILQPDKLKEMKLKIRPDLLDNFYWNGLIEFTVRRYFEDSLMHLANLYLKQIDSHYDNKLLYRKFEKFMNDFLDQHS